MLRYRTIEERYNLKVYVGPDEGYKMIGCYKKNNKKTKDI